VRPLLEIVRAEFDDQVTAVVDEKLAFLDRMILVCI